MQIKPFFIDKYPVTNAEFKKFLVASHYHPKDDLNFLRDLEGWKLPEWMGEQASDVGIERTPVPTRDGPESGLPHEWEWQYAAQGNDGRIFPWGNDWDDSASRLRIEDGPCEVPIESTGIPGERVPSA